MKNFILLICFLNSILANNVWPKDFPRSIKIDPKMVDLTTGKCDYCAEFGQGNTYCKNYKDYAKGCGKVFANGVNAKEREQIVDIHNTYRRNIAKGKEPLMADYPASDMIEMVWDDEMARGAQMWANQCNFRHDSNRVCRFRVGQNIYISGGSGGADSDWEKTLSTWYSEVEDYKGDINKFHGYGGTGHFTQMIWGFTEFVGCGRINHAGYLGQSGINADFYVCNYGRAGNFGGHPVYKVGPACSNCPAGTTCADGLCSKHAPGDTTTTATTTKPDGTTKPAGTTSAPDTCELDTVLTYLQWCESLGVGTGHKA